MALSSTVDVDHKTEILEYYQTISGHESHILFQDLDDASTLRSSIAALQTRTTSRNFVVDFSDDVSWICLDILPSTAAALLETERPEILNARWINVWYPALQKPLLELLAKRYDFSPRLLALMCSDPPSSSRASQ